MHNLIRVAALGMLAAAPAGAQQSSQPGVLILPPRSVCPIGLSAQHATDGGMMAVQDGKPHVTGQVLQVTLTNTRQREIRGVQLTVHGVTDKPQIRLTGSRLNGGAGDIVRTVELRLDVAARKDASASLSLPRFTAVLYLDLDEVEFADGSSWHAPAPGSCRVEPDHFMLIDARHR